MDFPESTGESSCKRQENGDVPTGSERPLKKARFAWQVKGKYHLKNDIPETVKVPPAVPEPERSDSSSTSSDSRDIGTTEQNLEILGNYLLKQDFSTLDSVITDSHKPLIEPATSIMTERHYPRYVSSRKILNRPNDDSSLPISMVLSQSYNEDQCIARWQARQMEKGFVDNTINRFLDLWMGMGIPLPLQEDNSRFLALDVADFINNLPGDNSIENEGILMAISAHGLQNASRSSSTSATQEESHNQNGSVDETSAHISRSSSLCSLNDSDDILTINNQEDRNFSQRLCFSKDEQDQPFPLFPDSDNLYDDSIQNNTLESDGDDMATNHFDFLDAAVSYAIQSKGLTAFGADYG